MGGLTLSQPTIEGYDPVRLLERSSYTETWLAWHDETSKRVQLKLARRAPVTYAALEELSREYRTTESLRHPGLARPIAADFGRANPYAVYEYVEGQTLADLIEAHGNQLAPELVLRVGYELTRTLTYVHQRGYVHLDLRPEITTIGVHGTVLTDLKMVQARGSRTKRIYRQDQYGVLAAEQLRGSPAAASMDVFALGSLLYQATHGVLASTWSGTLGSHRRLRRPALPAATGAGERPALTVIAGGGDAAGAMEAGHPGQAAPPAARSVATLAALEEVIDRLTVSDPTRRPSAEDTLAMLRHLLLPAPRQLTARAAVGAPSPRPELGEGS